MNYKTIKELTPTEKANPNDLNVLIPIIVAII
jgi:hypothetical protein